MKRLQYLGVLLAVWLVGASAADLIGFRLEHLPKTEHDRALELAIWYPASSSAEPVLRGDNAAFYGEQVVPDAKPLAGRHPLVLISHGYGGNWSNQQWLAAQLAQQGYIVAAPNHPGTTSRDMHSEASGALWLRPRDISQVIDHLTTAADWSGVLAADQIAVIGHSLGGWTAVELAGGQLNALRMQKDCLAHPALASCEVYHQLGAGHDEAARTALGQSLLDPRVRAVVSLDLGLARGFDPASLARVRIPLLVIAATTDKVKLPAALESGYLVAHLPAASTHYVKIDDAVHFSFMPVCKPGAAALLEADFPGDGIICQDVGLREREEIHAQVVDLVTHFLAQSLALH